MFSPSTKTIHWLCTCTWDSLAELVPAHFGALHWLAVPYQVVIVMLNPILTGLFESKFLLGGGGQFDPPPPPSDLGPKGADRRKILHGCEDTCKEYCTHKKIVENGLFIILL